MLRTAPEVLCLLVRGCRTKMAREQTAKRRRSLTTKGGKGFIRSSRESRRHHTSHESYIRLRLRLGVGLPVSGGPIPERASRRRFKQSQSTAVHHGPGPRKRSHELADRYFRFVEGTA